MRRFAVQWANVSGIRALFIYRADLPANDLGWLHGYYFRWGNRHLWWFMLRDLWRRDVR